MVALNVLSDHFSISDVLVLASINCTFHLRYSQLYFSLILIFKIFDWKIIALQCCFSFC